MKGLFKDVMIAAALIAIGVPLLVVVISASSDHPQSQPAEDYDQKFRRTALDWAHNSFADPNAEAFYGGNETKVDGTVYRKVVVRGRNKFGGYVANPFVLELGTEGGVVASYTPAEFVSHLKYREGIKEAFKDLPSTPSQSDEHSASALAPKFVPPPPGEDAFRKSFANWLTEQKRNPQIELVKIGDQIQTGVNQRCRLCVLKAPTGEEKRFVFIVYSDDAIVSGYSEDQAPEELKPFAESRVVKWVWEK